MNEPVVETRNDMWFRLHDVMEHVCNSDDESDTMMDTLADQAREIMLEGEKKMKERNFRDLEECFNTCEQSLSDQDKGKEFETIQAFILKEQNLGRERRKISRRLEAYEEKRLAGEIAALKGFRLKSQTTSTHEELHQKIADAERSYLNRKMVVAKAAQVANAECRFHFTRVREFFEELQDSRRETLHRQYVRSLKIHAVTHRLHKTDARVVALERQIINRLYHKKKTDLNELHMTQNMEEAMYLETMLELLFKVQQGKETAARELFELHVTYLKEQRDANERRASELQDLRAHATLEMARVVAHYTDEEDENIESDEQVRENVDAMERRKDFNSSLPILSVSQLYDTVLWSVATSEASGSSSLISSSDYDGTDFDEEEDEPEDPLLNEQQLLDVEGNDQADTLLDPDDESRENWKKEENDLGSDTVSITQDGSLRSGNSGSEERKSRISSLGKIHVKQLSKEFRQKEKEVLKKHEAETKSERRKYRIAARTLRKKHQHIVDNLLQKCLVERYSLRDAIGQRMIALVKSHEDSTKQLRKIIESDVKVMQEALRAEDQRLEEAEKTSFIKAQELISSQVFHEVRNALSSMISMSEMTSSLKNDSSLSPNDLVAAVDDMLEQIKEVVHYSLNMLNNILDVSKIKSGSFTPDNKEIDLQELVSRATKMQLAKVGSRVKMSFLPDPRPCIASTDSDIVVRIITNFISNAIKFTSAGAIQPFVWKVDDMFLQGGPTSSSDSSVSSDNSDGDTPANKISSKFDTHFLTPNTIRANPNSDSSKDDASNADEQQLHVKEREKFLAVGVADTGRGLSREMFRLSEGGLLTSDTGSTVSCVRNTGFGLHLAHLLAKALGTKLHLTSLRKCRHLLNEDMLHAMDEYRGIPMDVLHGEIDRFSGTDIDLDGAESVGCYSCKSAATPGSGTVLYLTIPIKDEEDSQETNEPLDSLALDDSTDSSTPVRQAPRYVFCPQPSPSSPDGAFRIMIADDVKMLRKGLVHGMMKLFPDGPLSISTACTAEDVLRAMSSAPYDLVICDNQFFHNPVNLKALSVEVASRHGRPRLLYGKDKVARSDMHRLTTEYFENECFTLEAGDGTLSGYEALQQLAQIERPPFPTPILILLSGHKFDEPPSPGVIVVQKPLNQSAFVPLLEASAVDLLRTGFCTIERNENDDTEENGDTGDAKRGKHSRLVNGHGSQIFILK